MSEYIIEYDDSLEIDMLTRADLCEEIVRCKYCKHTRKSWNGKRPDFVPDGFFCSYWGGHQLWEPDGFCKWGERKSK